MKPNPFRAGVSGILFVASPLAVILCQFSTAAIIQKADNASELADPASWVGGVVSGSSNIASWDATVTSANSTTLGGDLAWHGIRITNPAGAVTIGGAQALTLGAAGIDMAAASQSLAINSNLTLASGNQSWNILSGNTLTLGAGTFSRSPGATVNIEGEGTVTSGMSGLSNINGILGPWAFTGSGADTRYATLSAGTITPYTGATALSGISGVFGGMPSGGDGTVNYDIDGTGTFSAYGLVRNINTLRYIGGGATQQSNTSADLLTVNGILNAGTGTLNIGGGGNALRVTIGARNNLILAAESADITLGNEIKNGAAAGSVTIHGGDDRVVTLAGPNTYTGGTFVNSGRLIAGSNSMNGGQIRLEEGAALTFTGHNQISTSTLSGGGDIINDTANTIIFTGDHSGFTGTFTHSAGNNNTQFNAAVSASPNASYSITAGELIFATNGDYTLKFGELSSTGGTIRGGNSATGITTLEVGNLNTDSTISGNLNNGGTKVIALTKVGTGTLTLSGTNTYSGTTTILEGTLFVEGSISATNTINNQASLVFDPLGTYTFPNIITGSGDLTLSGGGTLGLTGANNFAGTTTLDSGELLLNGSFGPIAVVDDWFNVIGPVPGGSFTAASLVFEGQALFDFNLPGTPGGSSPVTITGALTTTPAIGKVDIEVNSLVMSNGTHNLIDFGTFNGSVSDFNVTATGLNARQSVTPVINGNTLAIVVDGDTPKWTGLDNGNWRVGSTGDLGNWQLVTGGTSANYIDGDDILFDDSAPGTTTVNIDSGFVSPRVVVVENSTKDYTISSASYGISTGALTKTGTASLTIASDNLLDEGIDFESGTLNLNSPTAIGTGPFSILPGPAKAIDNTSGTAVANPGMNTHNWFDDFTFTGSNDLDLGRGIVNFGGDDSSRTVTVANGTLRIGEIKAPSHGLVKAGAGTLILASTGSRGDASVLGGTLDVAGGTLQINRSGADSAASGDLTATGLTGSGTIANGADIERWLLINTTGEHVFDGVLTDGGAGRLGFNMWGSGKLALTSASNHSGDTGIGINLFGSRIGVIRAEATQALGTGAVIIGFGGNESTARLELDGGISLNNPITIAARNTTATAIQSTSGNNALSGTISITLGGANNTIQSDADTLTLSGSVAVTNITNAARFVTFLGAGDINVTGAIENGGAGGSLGVIKTGTGTLTFNGANTYTGDTTVNQGILEVANPVLADVAAVRIAEDGTLHLSHGSADTVDRLFIDGVEQFAGTWGSLSSSATHKTGRITGDGILNVVNGAAPPSGYGTWAAATGLTPGVDDAPTFDADSDGFDNGTEYILGGLPLNAANNPKIFSLLEDSSADANADRELVMTIAVPVGTPAFSAGSPASTATFEGFVITVRGSNDLVTFDVPVTPVDPITTGLPAAPVHGGITYEYRSFSLDGSNGLPGRGFLQVGVASP